MYVQWSQNKLAAAAPLPFATCLTAIFANSQTLFESIVVQGAAAPLHLALYHSFTRFQALHCTAFIQSTERRGREREREREPDARSGGREAMKINDALSSLRQRAGGRTVNTVRPSVRDAQNARYAADALVSKVKGGREEGDQAGERRQPMERKWYKCFPPLRARTGRERGRTDGPWDLDGSDRRGERAWSEWESTSSSFLAIRAVRLRPKLHS